MAFKPYCSICQTWHWPAETTNHAMAVRDWTQDEIDEDMGLPLICPVTGSPCLTEQDEFCDDYGCARKAGIDVDRDLIA